MLAIADPRAILMVSPITASEGLNMTAINLSKYAGREGKGNFVPVTCAEILNPENVNAFGYVRGDFWMVRRDGSAVRVRVNGKIKRWKRTPERFEIPMAYGMYEKFRITNENVSRGELLREI